MINTLKLCYELIDAGVDFTSCDENGVVRDKDGNEIQDTKTVQIVVAAHDPAPIVIVSEFDNLVALLVEKGVISEVAAANVKLSQT